jgi:RNA polymerase sigma factor (sigma-70 family)
MGAPAPEEVVRILRTARTPYPDPRLDAVLTAFRRHWLSLGRAVHPELESDFDDAVQHGLMALTDPDELDRLRDETQVLAWARGIFRNKLATLARERGRERRRRQVVPEHVGHMIDWLAEHRASYEPTPEEQAILHQRVAIVVQCLHDLPLARAKFLEDVPDKELALRFGKTNDAVRNYLKRVRKVLRTAVEGGS